VKGESPSFLYQERTTRKKMAVYGLPFVNAELLLIVLTAFPVTKARWSAVHQPILFECDFGDAILLPIRRKTDES